VAEARGEIAGLSKLLNGEMGRARGLPGSVARRSSGSTAGQRGRRSGAKGAAALGLAGGEG
jgi:hypothetical protein